MAVISALVEGDEQLGFSEKWWFREFTQCHQTLHVLLSLLQPFYAKQNPCLCSCLPASYQLISTAWNAFALNFSISKLYFSDQLLFLKISFFIPTVTCPPFKSRDCFFFFFPIFCLEIRICYFELVSYFYI